MPQFDYDLFTLGGGSGGVRGSRVAAQLGAKVGLAEASDLGGTCVNVGCIPKKLMVYASHFRDDFENARAYGWDVTASAFDWPAFITLKDREIGRLNGIYEGLLERAGVDLHRGWARVVDPHTVEVDGKTFTAAHILVATGSWPEIPAVEGAQLGITSNEAFHLKNRPQRVVVVGGGYIAAEFATIWCGMGSKVTLVHRRERLLRGFDHDLRQRATDGLAARGVSMVLSSEVQRIEERTRGLEVHLTTGERLEADCLLWATGRKPRTDGMGLAEVGVQLAKNGAVVVDGAYQTSVPHIYAVGDVIHRWQLTPIALGEGMVVAHNLFGEHEHPLSYEAIPTAVFSIPTIATVGLSEEEAQERFTTVDVYTSEFRPLKLTLTDNPERIFMKLVVDPQTDRVLGCHMAGEDAAEIIQALAVALRGNATKAQFDATLGLHPTSAEEFVTMRSKRD